MKALTINPETKEIEAIEIEMKANTVYSFFNSILIDELPTLNQHIIYSDANALSQKKEPFFLGEQLILGNALIVGQRGMEEIDASIPAEELESLIDYEVNDFYRQTLALLSQSDINLYRSFVLQKEGEAIPLNIEWVLYTFNMADERTKEYFLNELKQTLEAGEDMLEKLKKMGQLALNAAQ
ncbi:hypothetical protein [Sulfurimonas sp. HSL3-7]|uniref:hypothetical protein n=1 Tax=Sulfonitrofixus jiaomeiensis TaxID=3131938 RepID=UPI0031F87A67